MACFIIPLTQAIATTALRRHAAKSASVNTVQNPFHAHLPRLEAMLYGGSAMLIVDHILSGELMPVFPFFSALATEGGLTTMLREMLLVGIPMSLLVTALWAISVLVSHHGGWRRSRMCWQEGMLMNKK